MTNQTEIQPIWTESMGMFSKQAGWELAQALYAFIKSHPPYVKFNTDEHLSENSAYKTFVKFALNMNPEFSYEGKFGEMRDTEPRDIVLGILEDWNGEIKLFLKLVEQQTQPSELAL